MKGEPIPYVLGHGRLRRGSPPVELGKRWCGRCQTIKPEGDFFRSSRRASGLQGHCKDCSRAVTRAWKAKNRQRERYYALKCRLRQQYGLAVADYEAILDRQDHRCAICDEPEQQAPSGVPRLMSIDHDHQTGRIRGALCNNCNRALGLFRDNADVLGRAVAYLNRP